MFVKVFKFSVLIFFIFIFPLCSLVPVNRFQVDEKNLALNGYDAVAFQTQKQALPGKNEISYKFKGATFIFSSQENRALFTQNPEKYAPRYGGHCAYGMTWGLIFEGRAEAWHVHDGKLYLYNSKQIRDDSIKDKSEIKTADRWWSWRWFKTE